MSEMISDVASKLECNNRNTLMYLAECVNTTAHAFDSVSASGKRSLRMLCASRSIRAIKDERLSHI